MLFYESLGISMFEKDGSLKSVEALKQEQLQVEAQRNLNK